MKEETSYTVKIWTNNTTNFGFSDLKEAEEKLAEIKKTLKSNQKVEFIKEILKKENLPV